MKMSESDFRAAYGKLVAATWSDKDLIEKLKDNPQGVLDRYGIETDPDSTIRVVEMKPTGKGTFEEQWDDWKKGASTGKYDLWLPTRPTGLAASAKDSVGTTCTPCCCCT